MADKIWGCLLHLSFNMWEEYIYAGRPFRGYRAALRLSEPLWNDAVESMAREGMNLVVIDLGDAVSYMSHPEIAVQGAWSVARLREELKRMRKLGLEPIPKLNFSAAHDTWLKTYSRMVSTEEYYSVCSALIAEVADIFDKPRFFHLGMDEETAENQKSYNFVVVRQEERWWGDFYFLAGEVEKAGARPWIWSDYVWHHPELFYRNMPKSVIQSNWYYGENFDLDHLEGKERTYVSAYVELGSDGYDQIPTGSFHADNKESIGKTVRFGRDHLEGANLLGFLQTFWKPTIEEYRERILEGIRLAGEAKRWYTGEAK
ncbi:MAG TPA: hypothetical protein VGS79_23230 [Puia sp.]|nr:hypothetical protein [Puia sp.]